MGHYRAFIHYLPSFRFPAHFGLVRWVYKAVCDPTMPDALWISEDSYMLLSSADDERSLKLSETLSRHFHRTMEVSNPSILPSDPGVGNGSLVSRSCEWLHGETGRFYSYRRFSELDDIDVFVDCMSAWMSDHYTHTTSKRTYDLMGIRYSSSRLVDPRDGDLTEVQETPVHDINFYDVGAASSSSQ